VADRYEIRVRGSVDKELASNLGGFEAEVEPAETILRGAIPDQDALHVLLDRVQGFGLELVEVRQLDASGARAPRRQPR
jgi:hypothetical protein